MYLRICHVGPPQLAWAPRQNLHMPRGWVWVQDRQYWLHSFLRRVGCQGQAEKRSVVKRPWSQGAGAAAGAGAAPLANGLRGREATSSGPSTAPWE